MKTTTNGWWMLLAANVAVVCMLSFYRTSGAAPQNGQPPFANAVDQRAEMIRELKEIHTLLQEQNAMLRDRKNPKAPTTQDLPGVKRGRND